MNDVPLGDGFFATAHRFVWHEATRAAVLSDVHLGAELTLREQGLYLPDVSYGAIRAAWGRMVERGPRRVVIAGDLFDSPGVVEAALPLVRELVGALPEGCEVTVLAGNHDPGAEAMRAVLGELGVGVEAATAVGGYAVFHGHRWADGREVWRRNGGAGVIVGHQHPAVVVGNRVARAKMICYAAGVVEVEGKRVRLVVLPAFSPLPLGSNLLTERHWIVDLPRPHGADVRVLGLVEPKGGEARVLDFGMLADLPA
ncbi:MAG TPA: metallophosphoesterase [Phycisphaerae bacterium]|nr:metallophosphoesterase [Phycisphaerae bacterium]